jgi:ABC-type polysaccharide transport system permease subunit
VGFQHFRTFFSNFQIKRLLLNTLGINAYSLLGFWKVSGL